MVFPVVRNEFHPYHLPGQTTLPGRAGRRRRQGRVVRVLAGRGQVGLGPSRSVAQK